jgi:Cof subfamily protein (haloacid dehalogenase superfamily)
MSIYHHLLLGSILLCSSVNVVAFTIPFPRAITKKTSVFLQDDRIQYSENDDDDDMPEEARKLFDLIASDFLKEDYTDFPSALPPKNPFGKGIGVSGGKGSLYSDDELKTLLDVHNTISDELFDDDDKVSVSDVVEPFFIHDLVTNTLGETSSDAISERFSFPKLNLDSDMKARVRNIRAIASDVDGTILSHDQTIHPRTRLALIKAIKSAENKNGKIQHFFPATGKSRKGALDSIGVEIGRMISKSCAGVYLQGLFCVDPQGRVIFEKKLTEDAIIATEKLVSETGISIVAYDGDDLYTTNQTDIVIHLSTHYGEPMPVLLPRNDVQENIRPLSSHEPSMHKLLLMDEDVEKLNSIVRPQLEELAARYDACVTQALPTMLELLPKGCSKALGVKKVCEALGINPEQDLLAMGDAENDAGMLKMAAIGVAVGNASDPAREAADYIIDLSNDKGGVGLIVENFAFD